MQLPQPSPKGTVTQTIGVTDISIEFSAPGVKNRKIWGDLVPYDIPWRAGANSPTKITFSRDVVIAGKEIPAGSYNIFITPSTTAWYIHFNNKGKSVFDYEVAAGKVDIAKVRNDQFFELRTEAKPAEFRERLSYDIQYIDETTAEISMIWEKVRVSFRVDVQTRKHTYANIAKAVEQGNGYARSLSRAAEYALGNGDSESALEWAKQALAMQNSVANNWVMAKVQNAIRMPDAAQQYIEKAFQLIQNDGSMDAQTKEYWFNTIKTESAKWPK